MAPLFLAAAALGGAAIYFFDPDRGRRRRALVRDQAVHALRVTRDTMDAGARDMKNRSVGAMGRARSLFRRREAGEDVLVERVRAKLGRYVSHPGAIEVEAADGVVTLSGSVLRHEHRELLQAVCGVRGVQDVVDRLMVHKTAEGVSELQGGHPRRGEPIDLRQDMWAPSTRILTGAAGTTLALAAVRGGLPGLVLGAAGAVLLLRSTTNQPLRRLAGISGRRAVDIRKTITIDAPVEQVFGFLADYQNYPQFMRHVRRVEPRAEGQTHWVVAGPAGSEVQWNAVQTQSVPNEVLAWRTVEGSQVAHAGIMRFESFEGGTRVHLRMSYNPPAGAIGHAVAKLFGRDAKTELDEDLMRLKTTLETGVPPHDAAARETSHA
jgi:uncharacterized membrane protein